MKVIDYLNNIEECSLEELELFTSTEFIFHPFDDLIIEFLDGYSRLILTNIAVNRMPDIAALGFWLRKSNLIQIKAENNYLFESPKFNLSPRGNVFHIVPANVDTMFIYSMATSLLAGNKNIIRLSNRMLSQSVQQLIAMLKTLLQELKYRPLQNYISMIQYGYDDAINTWISNHVNVRMIWGGDNTIYTFKKYKGIARLKDVVFADRISLMVLKSSSILNLDEKSLQDFVKSFYNDSYTFNQMGCSSPQTIYFIGTSTENACLLTLLKTKVSDFVSAHSDDFDMNSIASLKLNKLVDDAINCRINQQEGNNIIKFARLRSAEKVSEYHGCGAGYFYSVFLDSITNLTMISNPKIQTISHFGFKSTELAYLKILSNNVGIDRIVPVGKALNFDYIWDGYNLIEELTSKVFFEE